MGHLCSGNHDLRLVARTQCGTFGGGDGPHEADDLARGPVGCDGRIFDIGVSRFGGFFQRCAGGGAAEAQIHQLGHFGVPRAGGGAAEDGHDNAFIAPFRRGGQVETSGAGVAGLDPVGAFVGRQEATVGVADLAHARIGSDAREQVVVFGVIIQQVAAHDGHVMCGRHVAGFCQAVGVLEGGVGHAKRLGGAVHAAGELGFGPFDGFPDGGGGVIGRFDGRGADQVAQGDGLARFQPQFAGRFGRRVAGDLDLTVERDLTTLNRLECDIKCHHFGEGGRVQTGIRVS